MRIVGSTAWNFCGKAIHFRGEATNFRGEATGDRGETTNFRGEATNPHLVFPCRSAPEICSFHNDVP